MNARPKDFFVQDSERGTTRAEFPTVVELMNGVYERRGQLRPTIEAITHISSGESLTGISNYNTTRILPAEPDAKQFGFWLESYKDLILRYTEEIFETHLSSRPKLHRLYKSSLLDRRKNANKAAIDLLQSWIEETPDEQQAFDLARLKETIDEQRPEEQKLFK